MRVRSVWVEAPHSFPSASSPAPRGGLHVWPLPGCLPVPRPQEEGGLRGSEGHSGQYLQAGCLRGPPGFKLFLQLHLGFVHEQLQMLYLHLQGLQAREHRFVSAVESEKGGREGSRDQGEPQKPGRTAVVPEARTLHWCVSPEPGIAVQRAVGSPRRLAIITGH